MIAESPNLQSHLGAGHIYSLEGLDAVGKTSVGRMLAWETDNAYLYCTDGSRLKQFRKFFDGAPTLVRFLYYYILALETRSHAKMLAKEKDVFVDRYLPSTIAYHKALGLNERWFSLVPSDLIDEISAMIYIQINEEERVRRLTGRGVLSRSDKMSIDLAPRVHEAYKKILPERTIVLINENRSVEDSVMELKAKIYGQKTIF